MTVEEAIAIIRRKTSIPDSGEAFEDIEKAYDMAIEALEKQISKKHEAIQDEPAADVAPVVRCKDCEHWGTRKADGYGFCCIWGTSVEGNAFCSSGVKRRT